MLLDSHNRSIRDLRISLTDRCNFRCFYCLPNGEPTKARRSEVLSFEEIEKAVSIFVELGIEKIRLTGGEPMLRKNLPVLIEKLSVFKPQLKDIALTTNGFDLPKHAADLKTAGLDRITLSLDSLDRENFKNITGVDALSDVLNAVEAARNFGFDPVKINAVIVRGRNDHEIVSLAGFARENAIAMRFIEYMPLDSAHVWDREMVVSGREIFELINGKFPLTLKDAQQGSNTARNYVFTDGSSGEIGIIAPVTDMFCGACSRIRITADGQIRTCLFSRGEHDLRGLLRSGADADEIADFIRSVTLTKEARHTINDAHFVQPSRSMSFIGG
jgi:cyclic pyranopterin phosphate synthase